jgi:hypothetical protein
MDDVRQRRCRNDQKSDGRGKLTCSPNHRRTRCLTPLTRPIPKEALPVVELLRKDVPRPSELPQITWGLCKLRFSNDCSAMGLHPESFGGDPYDQITFSLSVSYKEIKAFRRWWDEQTDPQAAVDAVWTV